MTARKEKVSEKAVETELAEESAGRLQAFGAFIPRIGSGLQSFAMSLVFTEVERLSETS